MRVIHRISHFILYSLLLIYSYVCHTWANFTVNVAQKVNKLLYRSDEHQLENSHLAAELEIAKKKLDHTALIFNNMRHDIELDEINNIANIVHNLITL